MIKELLTSALLVATPLNISYGNINAKNEYINYNNVQDQVTYDDQLLDTHYQLRTINYRTAQFGANASIDARSIVKITEDHSYDHYEYSQIILLKINNTANLNIQRILYNITANITNADKMIAPNPDVFSINYLSSLNTAQTNFIEGANYTTYNDLNSVYTNIISNMTYIGDFQKPSTTWMAQTDYYYVVIDLELVYSDNLIDYNGAFLFTMNAPIMTINEELTYEIPEIAGYEVVDIPGLMFTILGMPFAWLSTAFNFTIFPNTPYAVNISNILMAIVIGLIAIYIAKKIIK